MAKAPHPGSGDQDSVVLVRWGWAGIAVFALLVAAFPVYRIVESTRRADALAARETALVAAGRELWEPNCASCHGDLGQGEPGIPALNSLEFLEEATDEQIHHVTAAGIPGTDMTPWWVEFGGPLTDEQIRALVAFVRSWQPTALSRPDWRSPAEPVMVMADDPGHSGMEEGEGHGANPHTVEESPPELPADEPPPDTGSQALIVMTERSCDPLEIVVTAGVPFMLQVRNDATSRFSFEFPSQELHSHVAAGETISVDLTLAPGEYQFECLGSSHGELLGLGTVVAREP